MRRRWTAVLTVVLGLFFFALNVAQATGPSSGPRIHARTVAVLSEIDSLLPRVYRTWQDEAFATQEPALAVPFFPVTVLVPTSDVVNLPPNELREQVLTAAGRRVYREGLETLAVDSPPSVGLLSLQGMVYRWVGMISDDMYSYFRLIAIVVGALAGLMAAALVVLARGFRGLHWLGLAVVAAAVPSLLATLAVRMFFSFLARGQGDPFVAALLSLVQDILGIPFRNYLAFGLLGLAFILLSLLSRGIKAIEPVAPRQASASGRPNLPY